MEIDSDSGEEEINITKIRGHEVQEGKIEFDCDYEVDKKKKFGKFPLEKLVIENRGMTIDYMEKHMVEQMQKGKIF